MKWKKKTDEEILKTRIRQGVPYLSFSAFEKTGLVKHGFSTRLGGVSSGVYSSMNLSFTSGDDKEDVAVNFRRMADALDVSPEDMVAPYQAHTVDIRRAGADDRGKGVVTPKDEMPADGLMTDVPGVVLVTGHADCVPLFALDPVHRAVALSHSGWRGTVRRMGMHTVEAMKEAFGTEAEDLIVGIGPSICRDCYQVGEDVAAAVRDSFSKEDTGRIITAGEEKYHMDLWKANEIIFREAGVSEENIHVTDICTACNTDFLFSHRAMGGRRGGMAAFLCLK